MESIQKGKGLRTLLRKIQLEHKAAVVLALELELGVVELGVEVLDGLRHVALQGHIARLHLVVDKEKHIQQRHAVAVYAGHQLSVSLLVDGVGGVQQPRRLHIQVRQLRKLPGGQLVGEHIAVHSLHVGQGQRCVYLRQFLQAAG